MKPNNEITVSFYIKMWRWRVFVKKVKKDAYVIDGEFSHKSRAMFDLYSNVCMFVDRVF